jgi:hypothetical protein
VEVLSCCRRYRRRRYRRRRYRRRRYRRRRRYHNHYHTIYKQSHSPIEYFFHKIYNRTFLQVL